LTKAFNHRMLGHVAGPFKGINDVTVFIDDGRSAPIVPQPHGQASERLILTLALHEGPP